ncbi:MAG: hypothetical protein ACI4CT_04950 [Lachnospiraceae bacterium]
MLKKKRCLMTALLCIWTVCSMAVPCKAATTVYDVRNASVGVVEPQWETIGVIDASLTISANGRASAYASTALTSSKYKAVINIDLQQYNADTGKYVTIKSWSGEDWGFAEASGIWYVVDGIYRTKNTVKTYNAAGLLQESVTVYEYATYEA